MIRFTVIVPNYNHAPYLKERIESILDQTYPHFELILLDDASTDESRSILETYRAHPKVKTIIVNENNSGSVFRQWKTAIAFSPHSWIWIAESDDKADPRFLEKCAAAIEEHHPAMVCTQSHWINAEGKTWFTRETSFETEGLKKGAVVRQQYLVYENPLKNASAVVFDRTLLGEKDLNALNEYQWCGDWYLYGQLMQKGDLYFINEPLNQFRRHPEASSNRYYEEGYLYKEGLQISLKHQESLSLSFAEQWRIFLVWTGYLLRQYKEGIRKKEFRLHLFSPVYYCILMHLALPFLWIAQLFKRKT